MTFGSESGRGVVTNRSLFPCQDAEVDGSSFSAQRSIEDWKKFILPNHFAKREFFNISWWLTKHHGTNTLRKFFRRPPRVQPSQNVLETLF